ncbi:MAG: FAD-binding oxidoreductase [Hyphomicrobiaceae bacterium]|nr:FAD-binding oxidoreductase [Hyphomicrobiaceae bacterium]
MSNKQLKITVRGTGIVGVWQAFVLASKGFSVTLTCNTKEPFKEASSWIAGAMLAPFCETESAEPVIRRLGLSSLPLWQEAFPHISRNGTLVVAQPRDTSELQRFARQTSAHEFIDEAKIGELEPDLAGQFRTALFYPDEAHLQPHWALSYLLQKACEAGVETKFGTSERPDDSDYIIDCRGIAARDELPDLRGVRGEMAIIRTSEISFSRPIRLLHPRFPLYMVPWPDNHFMIGATVIESDDQGPVCVRSGLELLGSAYGLHSAFGEAQIIKLSANVRPSFPDNIPKIIVRNKTLYVNGLYRHGFLTSPALAHLVADYLHEGKTDEGIFVVEH